MFACIAIISHQMLRYWFKRRDITEQHRRLAEIVEMIHTASLVHDDVLDESSVRRGGFSFLT